jgi:thioredoxin 1
MQCDTLSSTFNSKEIKPMSPVQTITQEQFTHEIEQQQGSVLVDFYAPWCGPCKMIAPVVEQIAKEFEQLTVVKIDSDHAQDLMVKYGIRGIPTLLLLRNGDVVDRKVGAASVTQLREFVSAVN